MFADGVDEFGMGRVLDHGAERTGVQRPLKVFRVSERGQNQDLRVRILPKTSWGQALVEEIS